MSRSNKREETDLVYALEGDVDSVSVFELAPALLALGQLIQESNSLLNPGGAQLAVSARPFRKGSFTVDIVLAAREVAQQPVIVGLVTVYSVQQVLESIGLLANTTKKVVGAIAAMKSLGQKPEKVEAAEAGTVRYTAGDRSVIVDSSSHVLLQNAEITNLIVNVIDRPMREPGIEGVRSYLLNDEKLTSATVTRQDLQAMRNYVDHDPDVSAPIEAGDPLVTRVLLNPKRGSFDGDPSNWSFRRGTQVIRATIRDPIFLDALKSGRIRLHASDLLDVELVETQTLEGTEVHVASVIRHLFNYTPRDQGPLLSPRKE